MKYITKFMDGSSVLCARCGSHPVGIWVFGKHWSCTECLSKDEKKRLKELLDDEQVLLLQ